MVKDNSVVSLYLGECVSVVCLGPTGFVID